MQLLMGLFFSILLTTGSSLKCEHCTAIKAFCSGPKEECHKNDVCMKLDLKVDERTYVTMKRCSPKSDCKRYEGLKERPYSGDIINVPKDSIIKWVECSKAPPSFASFFPAFIGLFLMKLLF